MSANVSGGSESAVSVALTPDAPVVQDGRLVVSADGADSISVDGVLVGTGHWEGRLASGLHSGPDHRARPRRARDGRGAARRPTRTLEITLPAERHGVQPGRPGSPGRAVLVAGLATGGYFLFNKPAPTALQRRPSALMQPGSIQLQWR